MMIARQQGKKESQTNRETDRKKKRSKERHLKHSAVFPKPLNRRQKQDLRLQMCVEKIERVQDGG